LIKIELYKKFKKMTEMGNSLERFDDNAIRKVWDNEQWYFSIVDIINVLVESKNPRKYWSKLKEREIQLETICRQFKMKAVDGKERLTDCANNEGVFRIIMSVPSPKAEPLKLWLARVGQERLEEISDPEIGFERLKEIYRAKGYDEKWIEQRLKSIHIRKELTDEWKARGVKEGQEYSILTAEISRGTFGITPSEHTQIKGLQKQNLRDHMTDLELVFTMLGEVVTKNLAEKDDAQGFEENFDVAKKGGEVAGQARRNTEKTTGLKVVSGKNFLDKSQNLNELPRNSKDE
jgi:DNA-damage-inducible protein D